VQNAETIHPEWQMRAGDNLVLHPAAPPLRVEACQAGRFFVAHAGADQAARRAGKPWVAATWLFLVEPLGPERCRLISRYRMACSDDLATRLSFGPTVIEPIGFAMDRRFLRGVKDRAERAAHASSALRTFSPPPSLQPPRRSLRAGDKTIWRRA
jgi:hypothetical protein